MTLSTFHILPKQTLNVNEDEQLDLIRQHCEISQASAVIVCT